MPSPRAHILRAWDATERAFAALRSEGLGVVLWPLAIGASCAETLNQLAAGVAPALHTTKGHAIFVGVGALFGVLAWVASARLGRAAADPDWVGGSKRLARWGSPLLLAPVLLALGGGIEKGHPFLVLALALLAAAIGAYFAYHLPLGSDANPTPTKERVADRWAFGGLGALVVAYTVTFSWLSITNHLAYQTGRADLGYYVSIFRRSSLGDLLGCTICGGDNHLSGHFDPILVLLSPLYWIYPEAEMVLTLQSLWLGSAMVPLFLLARHYGLSRRIGLVLALCFGLHPALHGVNLFDFHSLALLITPALWTLWSIETERLRAYVAFTVILLLVREDAALVAIFIGAFVALSRWKHGVKLGLLTIGVSALYFYLVKVHLMTNEGVIGQGYEYYFSKLMPKGGGASGLVSTVVSSPDRVLQNALTEPKVVYWAQLLVPVVFLPFLAPRGRFLLGYGALFTLLASRKHVYSVHFHYSSVVLPFLAALTAMALGWLSKLPPASLKVAPRRLVRALTGAMLAATFVCSWKFGAIVPNKTFRAGFKPLQRTVSASDERRNDSAREVCRMLPPGATVAADGSDLPHLGRCGAYYVKQRRWQADYLYWSLGSGGTSPHVRREIKQGLWEEIAAFEGGHRLYKNTVPYAERHRRLLSDAKGAKEKLRQAAKKAPKKRANKANADKSRRPPRRPKGGLAAPEGAAAESEERGEAAVPSEGD